MEFVTPGLADRGPRAETEPAGSEALIELRHVSKSYPTDGGTRVTILDDLNLEVREGELLALLGQSGSGKSTLLRLMAGLIAPTQGAVLCHGEPLDGRQPLHVDRLSELRVVPVAYRRGKCPDRADPAAAVAARRGGGDRTRAGPDRAFGLRERLPEGALGRDAAARGLCAGAGRASGDPVHGRAVQRARCPHRGEPPHRGGRAVARVRPCRDQEHLLRHAQHRRGRLHGEPHRHHLVAPRTHQARDPEPAALSARRELGGLLGAGRPDPRGHHGRGASRRAGGRGASTCRRHGSAGPAGRAGRRRRRPRSGRASSPSPPSRSARSSVCCACSRTARK